MVCRCGISRVDNRTEQQNLNIAGSRESSITVDNLKVAQFIYLLLNNQEIREVIDTITSKAVLILGRFSDKRKVVLDALRDELRKHNYLPILFDFRWCAPCNAQHEMDEMLQRAARLRL